MKDSGRQIGEKLFAILSPSQKKELARFVRDYETGKIPADIPYTTLFRGQYFIPSQENQPLTEIQEGDLYFCLEQRLVIVRGQVIPLTVKEFEIFALLIQKRRWWRATPGNDLGPTWPEVIARKTKSTRTAHSRTGT